MPCCGQSFAFVLKLALNLPEMTSVVAVLPCKIAVCRLMFLPT